MSSLTPEWVEIFSYIILLIAEMFKLETYCVLCFSHKLLPCSHFHSVQTLQYFLSSLSMHVPLTSFEVTYLRFNPDDLSFDLEPQYSQW